MFSTTYIVCVILALLAYIFFALYLRKIKALHDRSAREHQLIIDCILKADTATEYHFWRAEADDFFKRYDRRLDAEILKSYRQILAMVSDLRLLKGFEK